MLGRSIAKTTILLGCFDQIWLDQVNTTTFGSISTFRLEPRSESMVSAQSETILHVPTEEQAPRGLSAEEKRVKLLEIFHETVAQRLSFLCTSWEPEFYFRKTFTRFVDFDFDLWLNAQSTWQLKEVEKLGPKMKGIGAISFAKLCWT